MNAAKSARAGWLQKNRGDSCIWTHTAARRSFSGERQSSFQREVAAVLPHSDEMMALASAGLFALRYPDHPITTALKQVTARLAAG